MAGHARRQCPIPQEDAQFNVTIKGRVGQVGRSDEDRLVISDDGLGVKDGARAVEFD